MMPHLRCGHCHSVTVSQYLEGRNGGCGGANTLSWRGQDDAVDKPIFARGLCDLHRRHLRELPGLDTGVKPYLQGVYRESTGGLQGVYRGSTRACGVRERPGEN
eukprot:1265179-Pyramimonas_sp.AAC.1